MPSTSRIHLAVLTLFAIVFARGTTPSSSSAPEPTPAKPTLAGARTELTRLPTRFEENAGQTDARVRYLAHRRDATMLFTDEGTTLTLHKKGDPTASTVLRLRVDGGQDVVPVGRHELVTRSNYFVGRDPAKWRTGVRNFGEVAYAGVRDGVDLVYHGEQGQLEYDFVVKPGADASALAMTVEGAKGLSLTKDGDLAIETAHGSLVQHRPRVYQNDRSGQPVTIASSYRLLGGDRFAFHVADYDRTRELVIDPTLAFASYFGGTQSDQIDGVAADAAGNMYVTGSTASTADATGKFPAPAGGATGDPPADQCSDGCSNDTQAFVSKINATGSAVLYTTYYGSGTDANGFRSPDSGVGIALDAAGNAYVVGQTGNSAGLPAVGTALGAPGCAPGANAFFARFDATGALTLSSPLTAGSANTIRFKNGFAYVGGTCNQLRTNGGGGAGFVMKVDLVNPAANAPNYVNTTLAGLIYDLDVDSAGSVLATGSTGGQALAAAVNVAAVGGGVDVFVTKLDATGARAAGWTSDVTIGGTSYDVGNAIAVDAANNAYVTGVTQSTTATGGFPTTANAFKAPSGATAASDAFLVKLAGSDGSVVFATLVGGDGDDAASGVVVDATGSATIVGQTSSDPFPSTGEPAPFRGGLSGPEDIFVTRLNTTGTALSFSTLIGGTGDEYSASHPIALVGSAYYLGANTSSTDTIPGALQPNNNGDTRAEGAGYDGFIAKVAFAPLTISPTNASVVPHGKVTFTAAGGVGVGYAFSLKTNGSGGTINPTSGDYTAGATGNSTDVVQVTDPSGASATATVSITANLAISPAAASVAPKGAIVFGATGGSPPYTFTFAGNASGGSVGASGNYLAGPNGNTTDVVRVTDNSGASATAIVTVSGPVVITPAAPEAAPLGQIVFSATGGSGGGYTWSLTQNKSGGSINPSTGVYHAGGAAAVDTVGVTDSLGNSATVNVSVGGALAVSPAAPTTAPLGTITFSAAGGSHFYSWSIPTNASGGTIDPTTGEYHAGAVGNVTDVVQAQDTNGATATVSVAVGPAIAITPTSTAVNAGAFVNYTVTGGAGKYVFSFDTNASGGTIDPQTGLYQAGQKGGDDHLRVTDANGAFAQAVVGVSLPPAQPPTPPAAPFTPPTFNPGGNNSNNKCSCRVVGDNHESRTPALVGGLILGLAFLARRRRR